MIYCGTHEADETPAEFLACLQSAASGNNDGDQEGER